MKGMTIAIFLFASRIPGVLPFHPRAVIVHQNEIRVRRR